MKKILVALMLLGAVHTANAGEKFGLGLVLDGTMPGSFGPALAFQYNQYKGAFGTAGLNFDYLALRGALKAIDGLSYYVGPGAGFGWSGPTLGLRAVFGLDYNINKEIDVFAELVPGFTVMQTMGFGFGGAFGARYFF